MRLTVKTLTGKTIPVVAEATDIIENVKERIELSAGMPLTRQTLLYRGKQLEDEQTLLYYDIKEEETLHLVLGLSGGQKKKKYTKRNGFIPQKVLNKRFRRRNRHRHNNKLPALKCYSVSDDNQVVRKNKECPGADCFGGGIRMADHGDRLSCGKCGLTYVPL